MKKRVVILISGGGTNMATLLDSMTPDHPAKPVLVLSNNADAGGLQKAADRGVATVVIDHRPFPDRESFDAAMIAKIDTARPDIICFAGFMRILTSGFVQHYQGCMLNIHPSLLPKFKGLHTHARALAAGDTQAGCSVHLVTPQLDDGPILGRAIVPILPDDTADTLAARVLVQEHLLYPAVLRRFADGDRTPLQLS